MTYEKQNKFHSKDMDGYIVWERVDKVREYKGLIILTITSYIETLINRYGRHRFYRVIFEDGHELEFDINKRGGNLKNLLWYLDKKLEA